MKNNNQAAPHNGTATSMRAATEIEPFRGTLRVAVLDFLVSRGTQGATAEEIEFAIEILGSTVRPRLVELRNAGLVVDSGLTRKTRSGRHAVVWIAFQMEDDLTLSN
jgi:transcription initiation factor IIE alpha subunit